MLINVTLYAIPMLLSSSLDVSKPHIRRHQVYLRRWAMKNYPTNIITRLVFPSKHGTRIMLKIYEVFYTLYLLQCHQQGELECTSGFYAAHHILLTIAWISSPEESQKVLYIIYILLLHAHVHCFLTS